MKEYEILSNSKKEILNERMDILLALGTAFRIKTYPAIDSAFHENPTYYHELAQEVIKENSELYRTVFIYPVEMDRKTRQMIGIIEHVNRNPEDIGIIDRILNKGFQSAKRYAQRATPQDTFEKYYKKKFKNEINADVTQITAEAAVSLYYGKRYKKSMGFSDVTIGLMLSILDPQNYYEDSLRFLDNNKFYIEQFFDAYGIPFPVRKKQYTIFGLLNSFKHPQADEKSKQQRMIKDRLSAIGDFYDTTYIDSSFINGRETLTGEEVLVCAQSALANLSISQENDGHGTDELLLFITNLYTRVMSNLYNQTKELANVGAQEEMLLREKDLHKEHQKREKKVLKELDSARREELRYKDLYERSLKENENLSKQISQLERKIDKQASYEQEIVGLRNFLYQQQTEAVSEVSTSLENMVEFLQEHSFAIFGGHPNFTQKIKELLPNVRFITPDDQNKSFKFVSNMTILFVFTEYFNHSTYYKLLKEIGGERTRLVYLPKTVNREMTIQYLYDAFQE